MLGAIIRAAVLPLPGTVDVNVWKVWSFAASIDLAGVYGVGGTPTERRVLHWQGREMTVNYPPLAVGELALAGRLYRWRDPLFRDSAALNAFVKLPGLAAELLLLGFALVWVRRRFGPDASAWTALALWLSPALLLAGPVLGYIDAQMAASAVLAVVAAWTGAGWLAGALAAFAALTKPQALFVWPVVAAVLVSRRMRRSALLKAAAGAGAVSALVLLPYAVRGAGPNLIQAVFGWMTRTVSGQTSQA